LVVLRDLLAYKREPSRRRKAEMRARFDRIFKRRTGFATLDRLLARLHANKAELLMVLDRPHIPLHTNGSEGDIRCHVIKRKISCGTRSDAGRYCRDAFLGLAKTCAKLVSLSGTTPPTGSKSLISPPSKASQPSSNSDAGRPDRPTFCPSYLTTPALKFLLP
jgi:Transposase IS66 family